VQCDYLLQLYKQQLTEQTACDRYRNSEMCLLTAAVEQQLTEQTACDRYRNSAMCLLTAAVGTAVYRTDSM